MYETAVAGDTKAMNAPPMNLRILVVENDHDSLDALRLALVARGSEVVALENAHDALVQFRRDAFDAVVTDIRLVGMSGVDLLREIRKQDQDFPVILLTGFDNLSTAIEAVQLGAQDYILKPMETIDSLLDPLYKSVRAYRMHAENRRLQEELLCSERRFRAVLESSRDILFRFDLLREKLDYVSPAQNAILGYDLAQLQALGVSALLDKIHPDDYKALAARHRWPSLEGGQHGAQDWNISPFEFRFRCNSGAYTWLSVSCCEVHNECGVLTGIVGNARDISARKAAEEHAAELRDKIARGDRIRSAAIAAGCVAHDLNSILMPIMGLPDMIERDLSAIHPPEKTEQIRGDLKMIRKAAGQAGQLIGDMLWLERRGKLETCTVDLNDTVNEYIHSAAFRALREARSGVRFQANVAAEPLPVKASIPHLVQMLMNLVRNAFDSIKKKGIVTVVTRQESLQTEKVGFHVIPPGSYAVMAVTDNGCGLKPEQMELLFEPFHSTKPLTQDSGSGLGLTVVYGIASEHGGIVDVQSAEGAGSTFSVYLPLSAEPLPMRQPGSDVPVPGGHERILIVDDSAGHCEMARRYLGALGYEIETVSSGQAALRLVAGRHSTDRAHSRRTDFDLVMMDMFLEEGFDGLDTYRELLKLHAGQRCLLMSAFGMTDRVSEALRLGAGAFLKKPFTLTALGMAVRNELDRAPAGRETQG